MSRGFFWVLMVTGGIALVLAVDEARGMNRGFWVLMVTGGVVLVLAQWRRLVVRKIAAQFRQNGNPEQLPLPTGLTIWGSDWRVYDATSDDVVRRLARQCRWLDIASVAVSMVGFTIYYVI